MMCVARFRFVVGCVAGSTLLSACAADQPASLADSNNIDAGIVRPATARDPETVRDAREATEEAVQRISGLASVAVSAVRELGKEAARSVTGVREGDAAAVAGAEADALANVGDNETGPE